MGITIESNPWEIDLLSSECQDRVSFLEQNDRMLTLDQLISEATALPDADRAILIDKIVESMAGEIDFLG